MRRLTAVLGLVGSVLAVNFSADVATASTVYQGQLEPGDAIFFYDGSLYDDYPIQGNAGQSIEVELRSDDFDPFLAIVGPRGEWLVQNDDIAVSNNNAALSFTFPDNGTYYIFVNAYSSDGQGDYTLILSPGDASSELSEIPLVPDSPPMPSPIIIGPSGVPDGIGGDVLPNSEPNRGNESNRASNGATVVADTTGLNSAQQEMLAAHNRYRVEVGLPVLQWSEAIATSAQQWANYLATTTGLEHSSSNYGENLWAGSSGYFSITEMVNRWGREQQYFVPDAVFPNVSTTGKLEGCGALHPTRLARHN